MDKLINFPSPRAFRSYPALLRELLAPSVADNEGEVTVPQALEKETSSIEDPLLCNVELPLREVFYPLGFAFEIVTNRQAVLDAASESWRHCRPRACRPDVATPYRGYTPAFLEPVRPRRWRAANSI